MGLLDFLNTDDARLGIGLLAAGGPTTDPNRSGFGQRIAGALQGVQAQKEGDLRYRLMQSQMDDNTSQIQARQQQLAQGARINELVARRFQPQSPGVQSSTPGLLASGSPQAGLLASAPNQGGFAASPLVPGDAQGPSGAAPAGSQPPLLLQDQAPQAQAPSGFPFSMADIALLGTAGVKNADTLFSMFKYATDGVKQEAGNYYKDPITGTMRYLPKLDNGMTVDARGNIGTAPNYATANAQIKGAETHAVEAAKFPFAVGADQARQTTQAALDTLPEVRADGNTYYKRRLDVANSRVPLIGPRAGEPIENGGTMASRNPISMQSAIALNDNWIKNGYQPTLEAGKSASDIQSSIRAIRSIDLKTGWGAEAKANAAGVLAGLGVGGKNAELYAGNAQKFQSVAMDRLQTALLAQKGTQTEGDAQRAGQTFASLRNTPSANDFVLDFAQAKANMDQRRAQFYEQALPIAQQSGDLTRVDREWRKIQGSVWGDPVLQRWAK